MKKLFSVLSIAILFTVFCNSLNAQVSVTPAAANYPTLTAAFTAIMAGTHGAAPTITITASFTETNAAGPILTNNSPTAITSLRIYTAGVFTVTGAAAVAAPIMTFNDIDNCVIDGRIGQAGSNRDLTFNHLNTASTLMGILNLSNGSSGNTMKYCNLTTLSLNGRMWNVAQSTAVFGGNNNNTIDHCLIDGGTRGVQTFGTAGVNDNANTVITNNIVTNANTLPIFIGSLLNGVVCNNNEIYNTRGLSAGLATSYRGMGVQGGGTIEIRNNRIHDLENTTAGNTYNYIGIITIPQPNVTGNPCVINIVNNCITLMNNALAANYVYGMFPADNATSPASTQNIYNNTVRIGGTGVTTSANAYYSAMPIGLSIAGSTVNSFNNIAQNERSVSDGVSTFHIGYDLTAYPAAGVTLNSDYNNGYSVLTNTGGWSVGYGTTVYRTNDGLANYKDSTCSVGIEQHTSVDSTSYAALNSCVFAAGSVCGNMNGTPLAGVTTDISGTVRNANYPYKGAYEGAGLQVLTLSGCLESKTATGEIFVELLNGCSVVCGSYADLNSGSGTAKVCFGDKITSGSYRLNVTSLNHLQTFSLVGTSFTGLPNSAAAYNFPVQGAFGGNLIGGCFYGGDRNQDSTIDLTDIVAINNDANAFLSGCRLRSDINSDGIADLGDIIVTFNNSKLFISVASPCPEPDAMFDSNIEKSERNELRMMNINKEAIRTLNF